MKGSRMWFPALAQSTKGSLAFGSAAIFNGFGWWATLAASDHSSTLEIIQLGGTGGLIVALGIAVKVLWGDRSAVKKSLEDEIKELRQIIVQERDAHRTEIAAIQQSHKVDLDDITAKYTKELKRQIEDLRNTTERRLAEERRISDEHYANGNDSE